MRPLHRLALGLGLLVTSSACLSTDPLAAGSVGAGGDDGAGPVTTGAGAGAGAGSSGAGEVGAGGGSLVVCGDDVCDLEETCDTCPGDCACGGVVCGDVACEEPTESCSTCPEDCGTCPDPGPACGDGTCAGPSETCDTCPEDCGMCMCVPDTFEPNGGSPTAKPIALGVDYCNLSICAGDFDWLEFNVSGTFSVEITSANAQGDIDLEVYSKATTDYVDGSYSMLGSEVVNVSGAAPGTYWARVYGAGANTENWHYCIRVD